MANSRFVVINTVHNNGHGESVRLVSSFSVLIVLLLWQPYSLRYTRTPEVSHFQSCLLVSTVLNQSFISLVDSDSF